MNQRFDRLTAILIDAVVDNHATQGIFAAAAALARHGVPLHLALRVLTRPWERRQVPTPPPLPCRN